MMSVPTVSSLTILIILLATLQNLYMSNNWMVLLLKPMGMDWNYSNVQLLKQSSRYSQHTSSLPIYNVPFPQPPYDIIYIIALSLNIWIFINY